MRFVSLFTILIKNIKSKTVLVFIYRTQRGIHTINDTCIEAEISVINVKVCMIECWLLNYAKTYEWIGMKFDTPIVGILSQKYFRLFIYI